MTVRESSLLREFGRLSQNSIKSVQSGTALSDLDAYLHVDRPVENILRDKMDAIEQQGGGIILLVGSAGDGKSHLLSKVRADYDWDEGSYYNDATASCSPAKTAEQTLKDALSDFRDDAIDFTSRKLVLAINLGKLNAFIADPDVKLVYSKIVRATAGIFDDDDTTGVEESDRIKIVLFTGEQIFELRPGDASKYPVSSDFLRSILERIVLPESCNPFWSAYEHDKSVDDLEDNPLLVNYEILRSSGVRETIVKTIIEAIVRFKLIITPREFLDFVYSIVVYKDLDNYCEKDDYCKALLPSLLYCGGDNQILSAVAKLDPVIYSNTEHNQQLAVLFTSYAIPELMARRMRENGMPEGVINRINVFYKNNGRNLEDVTRFVFRITHLLSYHSESPVYEEFIAMLPKLLTKDNDAMFHVYERVARVLPRHFGSFYDQPNMIPIEVQGGRYKLFTSLAFDPRPIESDFDQNHPTRFPLSLNLRWKVGDGSVALKVDYQMYSYLFDLDLGRLVTSYDNERSVAFGTFVRALSERSNPDEVTIVRFDGHEKKLKNIFGNVRLT